MVKQFIIWEDMGGINIATYSNTAELMEGYDRLVSKGFETTIIDEKELNLEIKYMKATETNYNFVD